MAMQKESQLVQKGEKGARDAMAEEGRADLRTYLRTLLFSLPSLDFVHQANAKSSTYRRCCLGCWKGRDSLNLRCLLNQSDIDEALLPCH